MKDKDKIKSSSFSLKISVLILLVFCIVIVFARYTTDEKFRQTVDTNIFRIRVEDSSLKTIEIDSESNPYIFAFDKYITILNKNSLREYSQEGELIKKFDINISSPIVQSSGKYMVIAEKGGQNLYLLSGTNIQWETQVEGTISRVNVNDNGYVSVIMQNSIYKSVVIFYNEMGNKIFTTYLRTNYAICTDISKDNHYLAIGEVDYSGTIIKSFVKIVSAKLAETDADNAFVYEYKSENGEIITNINYEENDRAICTFNNYVQIVTPSGDRRLYNITENDLFVDGTLDSENIVLINKQPSGLFSFEYKLNLKSTVGKKETLYVLDTDLPKSITVTEKYIVLNIGNEVQVINKKGQLEKRFIGKEQISGIVAGDSIVGIIYKSRIDIIKL